MPDRKRFYDDPLADELTTRIVESGCDDADRPWVRLDETLFYPGGGGQPADRGWIEEVAVLDIRVRGDELLHYVERALPEGPVKLRLNRPRRRDHAEQHTAQHLLSAVLQDRHGRPTTAFHLGEAYSAIEVEGAPPSASELARWENEVNACIRENHPVRTRLVEPADLDRLQVRTRGLPEDHSGAVRLVEIEGIDRNTCGGTHLARLGEIQAMLLLDATPARGGSRIRFLAGHRARERFHDALGLQNILKERLGCAPDEFVAAVDARAEELKQARRRIRLLQSSVAESVAAGIRENEADLLHARLDSGDPGFLQSVAGSVLKARPAAVVVLIGGDGSGEASFLIQSGKQGPEEVRTLGKKIRDRLGAKGGGSGRRYQGRGGSCPSKAQLARWLAED